MQEKKSKEISQARIGIELEFGVVISRQLPMEYNYILVT